MVGCCFWVYEQAVAWTGVAKVVWVCANGLVLGVLRLVVAVGF